MKPKTDLYEIPYIGKAMVRDFALLGINSINDLNGKSHKKLYDEIYIRDGYPLCRNWRVITLVGIFTTSKIADLI